MEQPLVEVVGPNSVNPALHSLDCPPAHLILNGLAASISRKRVKLCRSGMSALGVCVVSLAATATGRQLRPLKYLEEGWRDGLKPLALKQIDYFDQFELLIEIILPFEGHAAEF